MIIGCTESGRSHQPKRKKRDTRDAKKKDMMPANTPLMDYQTPPKGVMAVTHKPIEIVFSSILRCQIQ